MAAPPTALDDPDLCRLALRSARVGVWAWDLAADRVLWSPETEALFGVPPGGFGGTYAAYVGFIHPDDRDDVAARIGAALARGDADFRVEHRIVRPDGGVRWVDCRGRVERDAAGAPLRMLGVTLDVSDARRIQAEHLRAEEALRESEARYRTLVEYAPDAIVTLDVDTGRFMDVNGNAERLFGLPRARLLEVGPVELSGPTAPDGRPVAVVAREFIQRALDGETPVFEWTHRDAAGREVPCEVRLVRVPAAGRRLVRGSLTDISGRKRLEDELRLAQKLEAIGRLAGGVAHDFNNLLTSILGYTDLARRVARDPEVTGHLDVVKLAAERGAELTGRLLAFARRQVIVPTDVDLNRSLADADRLLRRVLGEHVELRTVPAPLPPIARVDPGQLTQVIVNLAINARDAMPGGGRLTFEASVVELGPEDVRHLPDVRPGRYARLAVTDTGSGIPEDLRAHLFEPFFTTKGPGQGTGLGLATSYGIVKQHGGHIAVDSAPGRGTTFRVYLPLAEATAAPPAPAPTPPPARGHETVFVCEDDDLVRRLAVAQLEASGFVVVSAGKGEELLAQARAHPGPIDLLVTDVVMPGLAGPAVASALRALRPGVAVLFISGYAEAALAHDGLLDPGVELLHKPFGLNELAARVRAILDRRPA